MGFRSVVVKKGSMISVNRSMRREPLVLRWLAMAKEKEKVLSPLARGPLPAGGMPPFSLCVISYYVVFWKIRPMLANVPPCVQNATWASAAMFATILDVTGVIIPIAVIWKEIRGGSLPSPLRAEMTW